MQRDDTDRDTICASAPKMRVKSGLFTTGLNSPAQPLQRVAQLAPRYYIRQRHKLHFFTWAERTEIGFGRCPRRRALHHLDAGDSAIAEHRVDPFDQLRQ